MILGLHHAAISTPDIARLTAFYTGLLGFDLVYEAGWTREAEAQNALLGTRGSAARLAMLRQGNCYLELFEFEAPAPEDRSPDQRLFGHGLTHLCLAVRDIHGEYDRLRAAGMAFNSAPARRAQFSVVYGRDPDGNVVELLEHHDSAQEFAPHWL